MSKEAMLAGLADIRLPEAAEGGLAAELAVAIGVAALTAGCLMAFGRILGVSRRRVRPLSLAAEIDAVADLAPTERRLRLLHLLKARAPGRYAELLSGDDLYKPDGAPDVAAIEAELRRDA